MVINCTSTELSTMALPGLNTAPFDQPGSPAFGRFPALYGSISTEKAQTLETYAYQARLGRFHLTEATWYEMLSRQEIDFVTLVARVDCVLRQTRYKDASNLIQDAFQKKFEAGTAGFDPKQTKLLLLYQAYTKIYTKGALRYAISRANDVPTWLQSDGEPGEGDFKVRASIHDKFHG
jgi:hypothetical protein